MILTMTPNPYQARAVNSKKNSLTEILFFRSSRAQSGNSDLVFS